MSDSTDITTDATREHRCAVSYNVWTSLCLLLLWQLKMNWEFYFGQLANWKASLLTSSRVHPKYFRSINKSQSKSFSSRGGGIIGLRPNFDWVAWKRSQFERKKQLIFFASARYPISLLKTTLIVCTMFSMSHDFKPDFFEFYLRISWKSDASSLSTLPSSLYWKEKIIVQNSNNVLFMYKSLDSQNVYGCSLFQIKWFLISWNYLNLLKELNFKQHLRLLRRKTNWHVAGNVGYCPTLLLSAIRHLQPPNFYSRNRS